MMTAKIKEQKMTNCPNCGAPITGEKCEYCGTVFEEKTLETQILYADCKPVMTIETR